MLLLAASSQAGVFYVDSSSQDINPTGVSWALAFPVIQRAIDAAAESGGGEIWVKAGVYKPDGISRNASLNLKTNVTLFGGFRGGETNRVQRNVKANRTILSGDIGRTGVASDNSYHVLTGADNGRVDGFIITRGHANSAAEHRFGGGLLLPPNITAMTIANCTFEKNYAEAGGALHLQSSELEITNCTFYSNAAKTGGAIASTGQSKLRIQNSIFSSNFSADAGGALFLATDFDAHVIKSSFLYNSTDGTGGALSADAAKGSATLLTISDCTFSENAAQITGGALSFSGSFNPQLASCVFERNRSVEGAGAWANTDGVLARVSETTFSGNRGKKGLPSVVNGDAAGIADTPTTEALLAKKEPEPLPVEKPKRRVGNERVHNITGDIVELRSLVETGEPTVLVLGDLTDPDFIKFYRNIETAARDYSPKGIRFYYIYRYLLHPENNGYIQPFNQYERAQHIRVIQKELSTQIPWLCDVMENQTATALAPEAINSLFIFNAEGSESYAGQLSNAGDFRKALVDIAGEVENPTQPETFPKPTLEPINILGTKFVRRITVSPKTDQFLPLQLTPLKSKKPYYVKVRIEGNKDLRKTGNGQLYLGFHIDPLYKNQWNNRGESLRYMLKSPIGVIAPSIGTAPRVTAQATDAEPREFLLNTRKLDVDQPITLQVSYSVHSEKSKRNIEVQQQYLIHLKEDPFGGTVFGRQSARRTKQKSTHNSAFKNMLRRYDLDRNGKLTEDEVIGNVRSNFSEIDTNHDGAINEEEYLHYRDSR